MTGIVTCGFGGCGSGPARIEHDAEPLRSNRRPVHAVATPDASGGEVVTMEDLRIQEVRRQIAAGTYLTNEKLDIAAARLHEALRNEPA